MEMISHREAGVTHRGRQGDEIQRCMWEIRKIPDNIFLNSFIKYTVVPTLLMLEMQ